LLALATYQGVFGIFGAVVSLRSVRKTISVQVVLAMNTLVRTSAKVKE